MLGAGFAGSTAIALPTVSMASKPDAGASATDYVALFREWCALRGEYNAWPGELEEAGADALYARFDALENGNLRHARRKHPHLVCTVLIENNYNEPRHSNIGAAIVADAERLARAA